VLLKERAPVKSKNVSPGSAGFAVEQTRDPSDHTSSFLTFWPAYQLQIVTVWAEILTLGSGTSKIFPLQVKQGSRRWNRIILEEPQFCSPAAGQFVFERQIDSLCPPVLIRPRPSWLLPICLSANSGCNTPQQGCSVAPSQRKSTV
jgi:hypothetical protein